ncbi:hypothetical protein CMI37_37425 [Candidatus Pacearchaeota archaeon]|nr:hypothetical protein [Candidatus Pacearchaeota archaeon]
MVSPTLSEASAASLQPKEAGADNTRVELERRLQRGQLLTRAELDLAAAKQWIQPWIDSFKIAGQALAQLKQRASEMERKVVGAGLELGGQAMEAWPPSSGAGKVALAVPGRFAGMKGFLKGGQKTGKEMMGDLGVGDAVKSAKPKFHMIEGPEELAKNAPKNYKVAPGAEGLVGKTAKASDATKESIRAVVAAKKVGGSKDAIAIDLPQTSFDLDEVLETTSSAYWGDLWNAMKAADVSKLSKESTLLFERALRTLEKGIIYGRGETGGLLDVDTVMSLGLSMKPLYIRKKKALDILRKHSVSPDTDMTVDGATGASVKGTSFLSELGDKDTYSVKDLFEWLGY